MRRALRDDVISSLLAQSGLPWGPVDVLDRCGSTNAELSRRAAPFAVVTTDHQTSGRGRLAREWQTPALAAVTLSAAVPVPAQRAADVGRLPLVAGLAVRAALARHGLRSGLKWPNDVLVPHAAVAGGRGEAKICGILCEVVAAGSERLVVVGLGINVDQTAAELPDVPGPLGPTSMRLEGCTDVDRDRLVVDVLDELAARYADWARGGLAGAALAREYEQACLTIGREVDVHLPDGRVSRGRAARVDADGRLVVEGPDGPVAHAAGDVVHARLVPGGPA